MAFVNISWARTGHGKGVAGALGLHFLTVISGYRVFLYRLGSYFAFLDSHFWIHVSFRGGYKVGGHGHGVPLCITIIIIVIIIVIIIAWMEYLTLQEEEFKPC